MSRCAASLSLLLTLCVSCLSAPALPPDRVSDFTSNGFLDNHHYQITANASPDPAAKGLVAQRESAVLRARNSLQEKALNELIGHRMALFEGEIYQRGDAVQLRAQTKEYLRTRFTSILSHGAIIEEYYEKDNTAQVVYRISLRNLRNTIEQIQIDIPAEKDENPKE